MSENVLLQLSNALADAAETAGKVTVQVNARRRMPASGLVYASNFILTADHVIENEKGISVRIADGTQSPAAIAGRDPASDLALLRLEHPASQVAERAADPARLGQIVLVVGRPSPDGLEASLGTVSAIGGPISNGRGGILEEYIRTDGISYPGFSGGPLVAADGTVLGLNTSGLANGVAITIPSALAWSIAGSLAQHGRVSRGYLGIRTQEAQISRAAQAALNRDQATGLLIVDAEGNSPGASGGLLVGDILVALAGFPVLRQEELFMRLRGDVVGRSTPVEVLRGGNPQTLNVVIGEK